MRPTPSLALTLAACTVWMACHNPPPATQTQEPPFPTHSTATAPAAARPLFAPDGELTTEELPSEMPEMPLVKHQVPALPKGLPKPPSSCAAFAQRTPSRISCDSRAMALDSLASAIATTQAADRDAQLAGLEGCSELPSGLARALRAEFAPATCADVIVGTMASAPSPTTSGAVHDALVGLSLAGMLSRAATDPPAMKGKATKATVDAFIKQTMALWVREQAAAIESLAAVGSQLRYYGRAIVAVEAGMADMRFIDAVRSVPVPEEFENDEELRDVHLQGRELALEPRKLRGRDASLVGLGSLATVGVLRDPRVDRARTLLSRMFGGRPINALDGVLLPPLAPVDANTPELRLAARLPTFYASYVFSAEAASDAAVLRMLIEKGLSLPHRIHLRKAAESLSDEVRVLAARARLELGQNYWRRVDFDEAMLLLRNVTDAAAVGADARLLFAVAFALHGGHDNAADMMVKAPLSELRIGDVRALDHEATVTGPNAGMAAFDAALIKQLAAPASAPEAYWLNLAERFEKARGMLADVRHQKVAADRAHEAKETAAAIREMHGPPMPVKVAP